MTEGLFDADLGGGLFRKRVARHGLGKSDGFRTLAAMNKEGAGFSCLASLRTSAAT
jgi:hypothetical protein